MFVRLLGIVLIALCVWTGVEIYTKGTSGAFGGALARLAGEFEAPAQRTAPDRAADAFQRAWNTSEARVDRALSRELGPED